VETRKVEEVDAVVSGTEHPGGEDKVISRFLPSEGNPALHFLL
jgi:hypothetical protein